MDTTSLPDQYFTSLFGQDPLPISWKLSFSTSLLQRFTAESSRELRRDALKQAEASVDVPYPPLQIVNSIPFCLFSLYLYPLSAPFLNPFSSPSPPSLLSILCPPKITTSIYYILFTNGTFFCILFHTMTLSFFNNAFYKLEKQTNLYG